MSKEPAPGTLQQHALVLNRSWIPIGTTTVRRAMVLLAGGTARVVELQTYQLHSFWSWADIEPEAGDRVVRTADSAILAPEIIVLGRFDRVPRRHVPFSRRSLYRRDNHRCQYCSRPVGCAEFSIDHILPRSRGGKTTWENCVLACVRCNLKKADRLLRQTGMQLRVRPRRPEWSPCVGISADSRRPSWRHFLGERQWRAGLGEDQRHGAIA